MAELSVLINAATLSLPINTLYPPGMGAVVAEHNTKSASKTEATFRLPFSARALASIF